MNRVTKTALGLIVSVALSASAGAARADDDLGCASTDEAVCKADKDERVAQYAKGRESYENARTGGDFSEAYALARNLAIRGDKNGERLLKMVYMQLGWGNHRNYLQAYDWLSEGIADGEKYLVTWREKLIGKMTPEQLTAAKKKAGD
jgi:hypothetical protein